ncbi:MAG: zf-HC2 domain-containing protein [Candidatus Omnitrophota bacterium]|nr:MAG: zf-HC2 domain-containing protein [Candidatus Omnitrophota bacterium]
MDCVDLKKILPNYVLHIAPEDEMRQVEEHLCVCEACRRRLSSYMDESEDVSERVGAIPRKDSRIFEYAVVAIGLTTFICCLFLFLQR